MTEINYLTIGSESAPIKVESFINLACPYCKNFFFAADTVLKPFIDQGKVQHTIKHFDKTKQGLLKGTIANIYLNYQRPEETLDCIRELYQTQAQWKVSFRQLKPKWKKNIILHLIKKLTIVR